MENMKKKISSDLWFSLPDMKVTLKQLSEMVLKKFMSVKIHALKKASVAKLFKHIENKNESARSIFAALKNCIILNVSLTKTEQNN